MGEAPPGEAPTGVLTVAGVVVTLPNVALSRSSRDFKEDASQFLAIRRQLLRAVRDLQVTAAEAATMRETLNRYRATIAERIAEVGPTSQGHLLALDKNVAKTLETLGQK